MQEKKKESAKEDRRKERRARAELAARGYSGRSFRVFAYGRPVVDPAMWQYGRKTSKRKRSGYDAWLDAMHQQFYAQRKELFTLPSFKRGWLQVEIRVMHRTEMKQWYGFPRIQHDALGTSYVQTTLLALERAKIIPGPHSVSRVTCGRYYGKHDGVEVLVGPVDRLEKTI